MSGTRSKIFLALLATTGFTAPAAAQANADGAVPSSQDAQTQGATAGSPTVAVASQQAVQASEGSTTPAPGEIIVTAQKRSQNIQKVPTAITAISGQALQSRGLTSAIDLPDLVPGVRSTSPGGGTFVTTIIRGVGQQDISFHQEDPVATYVDGAYVGLETAHTQPVFDVDRVEVLKGPQGTLFGRNATGGLIQYISRRPSQDFDANVSVEYGSYNKLDVQGAVGGSLGGDWSGRFAFFSESGGAYMVDTLGGPKHNGNTVHAARASLLYQPSSDFKALFTLYADVFPRQPGPQLSSTRAILNPDGSASAVTAQNFAAYQAFCARQVGIVPTTPGSLGSCATTYSDPYRNPAGNELPISGHYWNATARIEANVLGGANFVSISNYQFSKQVFHSLFSPGLPTAVFSEGNPGGSQYSQEFDLSGKSGKLEWIAGLYGLYIDNHTTGGADLNDIPAYGVTLNSDLRLKSDSEAGFVDLTYHLTPKLSLILGGRVTRDHRKGLNTSGCTTNPNIPIDICSLVRASLPFQAVQFVGFDQSFSKWSWSARAVAQYEITRDVNLYAGVNRGTKAGGFNTGANELYPVSVAQFGPETLTNYEGGIKAQFFDRTLTLNASGFHYDYKNLQTFSTKNAALYVFNVDATINGGEFDASWRPIRGLRIAASGTYLSTNAKDVPFGSGVRDFRVPGAPKWSMNASAEYAIDVGAGQLTPSVSYTHVGNRSTSAVDNAVENIPAYNRIDLRLAYDIKKITVAFNVRNVTNELIYNAGVPFETIAGGIYNAVAPPRTYSASIAYRF